ncbi:MAG: PKD domain-containing protein, partial [bacterium]|nr:PKD domain-containing protein [bacterium]
MPLAYFVASPTSGNPPLWVWFTDMSIGATSWSWNFGDGGSSGERSTYHIYNSYGVFTVTQSVSGPGGSHSATATIITDFAAPTGSIIIDGGASYTNSVSVALSLSATDNSGTVSAMRFSNDGSTWSGWETYTTSKTWTLTSGDGTKTVYVQFEDNAGNQSGSYTDTIILDMTAPTGGSISINTSAIYTKNTMVNVSWTGVVDTYGLASVGLSNTSSGPYTWYAHNLGSHSWTLSGSEGTKTVFAVFMDSAGNISSEEIDTIILDTTAPTGGIISINTAATYTRDSVVVVNWFSAYDTYGVVSVGLRNSSAGPYTWSEYAVGSRSWTLTAGYGT